MEIYDFIKHRDDDSLMEVFKKFEGKIEDLKRQISKKDFRDFGTCPR